ncbi:MAG TPA: GGDEF domain-containing protein [Burkholderiaceae bacterium]|nr:GGDEF domain-containing protein [Burkholderiaceae bacterium]
MPAQLRRELAALAALAAAAAMLLLVAVFLVSRALEGAAPDFVEAAAGTQRRFALWFLVAATLLMIAATAALYVRAWRALGAQTARLGELDQLAHQDALTGLVNRRRLNELLPVELARARRLGYPLSVAMLDLDHFKRFNDKRGHPAGDALLRNAAQAWQRQLRPTDVLARYGGEEFTLVLPACDAQQAAQMIERLRPLTPERQTFSVGVATWDGHESADELLQRADLALLSAKRGGRNRTAIAGAAPQAALPLRVA